MEKRKTYLGSSIVLYVLFAIITGLNLFLCIKHEMWRDEAQAWMIAKSNSLPEMYAFIWQEGHPCLLHMLFWVAARCGLTFGMMKYFAFIICSVATFLCIRYSPFQKPFKYLLLFTPIAIYYLSVFARSYNLLYLFAVLLAMSWKNRDKHYWLTGLLMGLLASTHIITWIPVWCLAIYLFAEILNEKKGIGRTLILFAAPLICFCLPLYPQFVQTLVRLSLPGWLVAVGGTVVLIGSIGICILMSKHYPFDCKIYHPVYRILEILAMALIPVLSYVAMKLVMSSTDFSSSLRHLISMFVLIIAGQWIVQKDWKCIIIDTHHRCNGYRGLKAVLPITTVILALTILCTCSWVSEPLKDTIYRDSEGELLAEYIDNNIPDDSLIVTVEMEMSSIITATSKTGCELYYPTLGRTVTHSVWFDGNGWDRYTPYETWWPAYKQMIASVDEYYLVQGAYDDYVGFGDYLQTLFDSGCAEIVYQTPNYINHYEYECGAYDNSQLSSETLYLSEKSEIFRIIKISLISEDFSQWIHS